MITSTVAIATSLEVVGEDYDDLQTIAALERRGLRTVHTVWDDPGVDWSAY
jgi:hypothetical protein